jgi:uncharacterized protein YlaI
MFGLKRKQVNIVSLAESTVAKFTQDNIIIQCHTCDGYLLKKFSKLMDIIYYKDSHEGSTKTYVCQSCNDRLENGETVSSLKELYE